MATFAEIEALALELPQPERAKLAAELLESLPNGFPEEDDDDGLAEALRRSEKMERDPSCHVSHEEFLRALGRTA